MPELSGPIIDTLILRTASLWQLRECVAALEAALPGVNIRIIAQRQAAPAVSEMQSVSEVITIPHGPLNIAKVPLAAILRKAAKPDLLVVLYNEPEGLEYFHTDALAMLIPARNKLIHDIAGGVRIFPDTSGDPLYSAGKFARKAWYAAYSRSIDKTLMPAFVQAGLLIRKVFTGGRRERK